MQALRQLFRPLTEERQLQRLLEKDLSQEVNKEVFYPDFHRLAREMNKRAYLSQTEAEWLIKVYDKVFEDFYKTYEIYETLPIEKLPRLLKQALRFEAPHGELYAKAWSTCNDMELSRDDNPVLKIRNKVFGVVEFCRSQAGTPTKAQVEEGRSRSRSLMDDLDRYNLPLPTLCLSFDEVLFRDHADDVSMSLRQ